MINVVSRFLAITSFVLFHRIKSKKVDLFFNGTKFKRENSVKILGMIFDWRLNWREHIDFLVAKCCKIMNILRVNRTRL